MLVQPSPSKPNALLRDPASQRKPRKKVAPALTEEEQELQLLDVMEFASRTR